MSDRGSRRRSTEQTKEEVLAEIMAFVGLKDIKQQVRKLVAYGQLLTELRNRELGAPDRIGLHIIFKGPPGTGKTELARKFGKLFKAIGLLASSTVIERDRSTIVGSYLGQTEEKMKAAFDLARQGVLFIDEAYALAGIGSKPGDDMGDTFGKNAVDTLLKLMEDHRSSVVVIIAGYSSEMNAFLNTNTGLKSRFTMTFEFPHYAEQELLAIFDGFAEQWGYTVEPAARDEVRKTIRQWDIKHPHFGNGREVRNFIESIFPAMAARFSDNADFQDFGKLSDEELMTITADDVLEARADYVSRL